MKPMPSNLAEIKISANSNRQIPSLNPYFPEIQNWTENQTQKSSISSCTEGLP